MNNNSIVYSVFFNILLCFTFTSQLLAIRCNPNDKKVLLDIKAVLGNPYALASWDPTSDCCDWVGLFCDTKSPYRLISLAIHQADVSGQIPEAIGDLPYLQYLDFYRITNLTGTIPPSITKLTNLAHLTITNTNLSGPIPGFLTKLKKLKVLDLSFNDFTGSIPPEFSQFQNLEGIQVLLLSNNRLTGTIPKSFGNLNFSTLYLSHNKLRGDASFLFGKNKTVEILDLSRNDLTFDLSNVEFPSSLTYLNLNHNKIFGSLPQQLTQLQQLDVSYNRLCGEIPQGGNLQNLDITKYIHNRCLCGAPLPPCTTQLPN